MGQIEYIEIRIINSRGKAKKNKDSFDFQNMLMGI